MSDPLKANLRQRAGPAVLALAAAGLLGWLIGGLYPTATDTPAVAADDGWPPKIDVRKSMDGDNEVGELLIDDQVIIQFRGHTEKLTPYERAVIVAERLKAQIKPRDKMAISTGLIDGEHVVLVNEAAVATAVSGDGPEGMAQREVAQTWAEALASALGVELVPPEQARPWQPDEPYADKIVPIVSLGKGKQIGAARVNGPETAVGRTQAVVQIETRMLSWFEVQVYVPISTKVPGEKLARVQGVAVTAVGDFRL
jgi:hypothetical protein